MEDVREVYKRPDDPHRPVLCVDETSRQLLADTRPAPAPQPRRLARQDYEYQRHGTANLFMVFGPLAGWRQVPVTARRNKQDWARLIRDVLYGRYAAAEKVVLVQDNLNTHTLGALYETFRPAEARRLAAKLELHYTPKHGSWLNMAEIEFSALARALPARLAGAAPLAEAVHAWEAGRNRTTVRVNWHFTTTDARIKLQRLYPSTEL
jgi:hypothetical protein